MFRHACSANAVVVFFFYYNCNYIKYFFHVFTIIHFFFLSFFFSYDYSGYGASTGKPSEKNLYADIEAAWGALRSRYGVSPENIILYGQSIGTVPTVDLAARYEVGAVILHSALMSGMRVAFPQTSRTWFFDAFPRYVNYISSVRSKFGIGIGFVCFVFN